MSSLQIHIRPGGFLGNHMFQYMLAKTIESDISRKTHISGYDMDVWGLRSTACEVPQGKVFTINSNLFDYKKLIASINDNKIDHLVIRALGMRLEYYKEPSFYRPLFVAPEQALSNIPNIGDDELLFHIRGGDILQGAHSDYHPIPFNYYHYLIETTGLKPVFMGQIGDEPYSKDLKKEFAQYRFLEPQNVITDFETLRRAKNVGISGSSFSWMATWLSKDAENIYFPITAFLNQKLRPDIDLIPVNDVRYHFYQFPVMSFGDKTPYSFDSFYKEAIPFVRIKPKKQSLLKAKVENFIRIKKQAIKEKLSNCTS